MDDEPGRGGLAALVAAKMVCCGGLALVATGALRLSALGAWLIDGGFAWLALAAVLVAPGVWLWRARRTAEVEPPTRAEPRGTSAGA